MKLLIGLLINAVVFQLFALVLGDQAVVVIGLASLIAAYALLAIFAVPMIIARERRDGFFVITGLQILEANLLAGIFTTALSCLFILKFANPEYAVGLCLANACWRLLNKTAFQLTQLRQLKTLLGVA